MPLKEARTDRHNNPTAFTTQVAVQAGLVEDKDYTKGDYFKSGGQQLFTARLIGDPIELTIKVIDKVGFYTGYGTNRWIYIAIPKFIWDALSRTAKIRTIQFMYQKEGGTALNALFDKY